MSEVANATPRSAPNALRPVAQAPRHLDHLGVGHGTVEQVLRDAQVGVEERHGQVGLAQRLAHLQPEAAEPLAPVVRDEALERDQVHVVPGVVGAGQVAPGTAGRLPGRLGVTGEEGEVAAGHEQRPIRGVALEVQALDRRGGGVEVAGEARRARQPRPRQPVLDPRRERDRRAVGRHRVGAADRHEQVTAPGEQVAARLRPWRGRAPRRPGRARHGRPRGRRAFRQPERRAARPPADPRRR